MNNERILLNMYLNKNYFVNSGNTMNQKLSMNWHCILNQSG